MLGPHRVRIQLRDVYFRNLWTLGAFEILPRHYYDPDDLMGGIGVAELNDFDAISDEKRDRAERFAKQFNENYQRRPMGSGAFEPAWNGKLRIHAALCANEKPLTSVFGQIDGLDGPNDPRFRKLGLGPRGQSVY